MFLLWHPETLDVNQTEIFSLVMQVDFLLPYPDRQLKCCYLVLECSLLACSIHPGFCSSVSCHDLLHSCSVSPVTNKQCYFWEISVGFPFLTIRLQWPEPLVSVLQTSSPCFRNNRMNFFWENIGCSEFSYLSRWFSVSVLASFMSSWPSTIGFSSHKHRESHNLTKTLLPIEHPKKSNPSTPHHITSL